MVMLHHGHPDHATLVGMNKHYPLKNSNRFFTIGMKLLPSSDHTAQLHYVHHNIVLATITSLLPSIALKLISRGIR